MVSGFLSPFYGATSGCGWRNGLQIWRVAANILNEQTEDKGLGEVLTTPHRKNWPRYETDTYASGLVRTSGTN